jgi:hypothetical protein
MEYRGTLCPAMPEFTGMLWPCVEEILAEAVSAMSFFQHIDIERK